MQFCFRLFLWNKESSNSLKVKVKVREVQGVLSTLLKNLLAVPIPWTNYKYWSLNSSTALLLVWTHDKVANILFLEISMYNRNFCSPNQQLWTLTLDYCKSKILLKCSLPYGLSHVMDKVISTELPYYWM